MSALKFTAHINVTRIDKARLFRGKKGVYLDLSFIEHPDQHGNAGFVSERVSAEDWKKGIRGNIIGSWKYIETDQVPDATGPKPETRRQAPPPQTLGDDEPPF